MPNTLCHFAIQGPTSRLIFKNSTILWIMTGCIIPDIPWMVQRLILPFHLFNHYDERLYFTIQASLVFCLLLSTTLALCTSMPIRIFTLLAMNCLVHLLLDTTEIKWGNGVHLFAPLTWQMLQFNLIWFENMISLIGSVAGLLYLALFWKKAVLQKIGLIPLSWYRYAGIFCCLFLYLAAPFSFIADVEKANNRYIHTLREWSARPGQHIEFDRVPYFHETQSIRIFTGESISLQGDIPEQSGLISFKGTFLSEGRIAVSIHHIHNNFRDNGSYLGILLFCALWLLSLLKNNNHKLAES
jgi:hypothetical protein